MSVRALRRLLFGWVLVLAVLGTGIKLHFALARPKESVFVQSWWRKGERIHRRELKLDVAGEAPPLGAIAVDEVVVGEGPFYRLSSLGLVPGRDGVKATLDDKVAYATVDDLLRRQAYNHAHVWTEASFGWGTRLDVVLTVLAEQLNVTPDVVAERAELRRVRFERRPSRWLPPTPDGGPFLPRPAHLGPSDVNRTIVIDAIRESAVHLARGVDDSGRFRYLVDATTNVAIDDYNWPRHSGATLFLAQAAAALDDAYLRFAALRAGALLRDKMLRNCGANACIASDEPRTDIGSSALALIAFAELARVEPSYAPPIARLAAFLRSQQRPDGEFMHIYDRAESRPIDVQLAYYTGEATLALAKAHAATNDPVDLEAATKGLARLSGAGWSFFGSRYYFGEEHWTCQAVAELWERAPNRDALAFCSRWHEYQRRLQLDAKQTPYDADGAFGFGPLVAPRVTPASSRGEAAGALVDVLYRSHAPAEEVRAAEDEFARALAFVLRSQFHPGPSHLFADPVATRGAVPGSPVDWQLRIDYEQHAGGMFVRWLALDELKKRMH